MTFEGGVPDWVDIVMDDFRMGRTLDGKNASRNNLATHKYYDLIRKSDFDIMIAPIESNTFNACKSYLKLEEAGMHCVPIVGSNFGEYRRYQKEAPEPVCVLADGVKEWYRALVSLITSPERRAALATANLAYVRREHLISKKIVQWEHALQDVVRLRGLRKSEILAV
jgi:glycosyltransferase involved in cell wall biosynthesis